MSAIEIRAFTDADAEPIRAIIERAFSDGELVGFHRSEVRQWQESVPQDGPKTWVAVLDETVIGFLSAGADGVIVSPEYRRRGAGRALVQATLAHRPDLELSQWSGSPETAAFLESVGFRFDYRMAQLVRTGSELPSEMETPAGFAAIEYQHHAFDAYFSLLNTSFADHPTPLHLDEERVRAVHDRPDFNPARIRLIAIDGDPHRPVAFVRLRTHETVTGAQRGGIALIGVLPEYRGRGFARQLLRWGVRTFIESGIDEIELEVVTINERALPLYTSEGFEPVQSWPYWVWTGRQSS
ncbi:MAG: GNAT family N-acetyltransferase [Thermomicrobiales bacterium]|nr:GNAT family N-acetyltransferase [Thermomicrobiales bacterium]